MLHLTDKRIVVTGGAGFLGSHVVEELARIGVPGEQLFVPRSADYDLRERQAVVRLLYDADPDVVIHLAATVGGIGANRAEPGRFFYENIIMGVHLMEEARLHGIEKFVSVGTVCGYPKYTPVPFREEDFWNGYPEETNAPYGLAKKMLLVQGQAYRQQYGFNSIYLIPVNLYGPRDDFDLETSHVIPAIINKCLDAVEEGRDRIVVWGDGSPTREFLYVADAARGIVMATERYDDPQPVNLGSREEISIRELLEMVADMTGFDGQIEWDTTRPNGQPRRSLDVSKAKRLFGFVASVALDAGLSRTIAWYRRIRGSSTAVRIGAVSSVLDRETPGSD